MLYHCLLTSIVSDKSVYSFWSSLVHDKSVLLAAFKIFLFVLEFQHFYPDVSAVDLFVFILLEFIELFGCAE